MPMITCPDCRHQVSDAAVSCPSCGRPIANSSPSSHVSKGVRNASARSSLANLLIFAGLAGGFAVGMTVSSTLGWAVVAIAVTAAALVFLS